MSKNPLGDINTQPHLISYIDSNFHLNWISKGMPKCFQLDDGSIIDPTSDFAGKYYIHKGLYKSLTNNSNKSLSYMNLSSTTILIEGIFVKWNLEGCNFSLAQLGGCNFESANLKKVIFIGSNFENQIDDTSFQNADLKHAIFIGCIFETGQNLKTLLSKKQRNEVIDNIEKYKIALKKGIFDLFDLNYHKLSFENLLKILEDEKEAEKRNITKQAIREVIKIIDFRIAKALEKPLSLKDRLKRFFIGDAHTHFINSINGKESINNKRIGLFSLEILMSLGLALAGGFLISTGGSIVLIGGCFAIAGALFVQAIPSLACSIKEKLAFNNFRKEVKNDSNIVHYFGNNSGLSSDTIKEALINVTEIDQLRELVDSDEANFTEFCNSRIDNLGQSL